MVIIRDAIKSILKFLSKTNGGDSDRKWSVHYSTQKPLHGLLFLPSSSRGSQESELWTRPHDPAPFAAAAGPRIHQSERGRRGFEWRRRGRKMSSVDSDDEERPAVGGARPMTPLVLTSCWEGPEEEGGASCGLPTPEERTRRHAQTVMADIVAINVSGESFDRQAGLSRSLSHRTSLRLDHTRAGSHSSLDLACPDLLQSAAVRPCRPQDQDLDQEQDPEEDQQDPDPEERQWTRSEPRRIRAPRSDMSSLMETLTSSRRLPPPEPAQSPDSATYRAICYTPADAQSECQSVGSAPLEAWRYRALPPSSSRLSAQDWSSVSGESWSCEPLLSSPSHRSSRSDCSCCSELQGGSRDYLALTTSQSADTMAASSSLDFYQNYSSSVRSSRSESPSSVSLSLLDHAQNPAPDRGGIIAPNEDKMAASSSLNFFQSSSSRRSSRSESSCCSELHSASRTSLSLTENPSDTSAPNAFLQDSSGSLRSSRSETGASPDLSLESKRLSVSSGSSLSRSSSPSRRISLRKAKRAPVPPTRNESLRRERRAKPPRRKLAVTSDDPWVRRSPARRRSHVSGGSVTTFTDQEDEQDTANTTTTTTTTTTTKELVSPSPSSGYCSQSNTPLSSPPADPAPSPLSSPPADPAPLPPADPAPSPQVVTRTGSTKSRPRPPQRTSSLLPSRSPFSSSSSLCSVDAPPPAPPPLPVFHHQLPVRSNDLSPRPRAFCDASDDADLPPPPPPPPLPPPKSLPPPPPPPPLPDYHQALPGSSPRTSCPQSNAVNALLPNDLSPVSSPPPPKSLPPPPPKSLPPPPPLPVAGRIRVAPQMEPPKSIDESTFSASSPPSPPSATAKAPPSPRLGPKATPPRSPPRSPRSPRSPLVTAQALKNVKLRSVKSHEFTRTNSLPTMEAKTDANEDVPRKKASSAHSVHESSSAHSAHSVRAEINQETAASVCPVSGQTSNREELSENCPRKKSSPIESGSKTDCGVSEDVKTDADANCAKSEQRTSQNVDLSRGFVDAERSFQEEFDETVDSVGEVSDQTLIPETLPQNHPHKAFSPIKNIFKANYEVSEDTTTDGFANQTKSEQRNSLKLEPSRGSDFAERSLEEISDESVDSVGEVFRQASLQDEELLENFPQKDSTQIKPSKANCKISEEVKTSVYANFTKSEQRNSHKVDPSRGFFIVERSLQEKFVEAFAESWIFTEAKSSQGQIEQELCENEQTNAAVASQTGNSKETLDDTNTDGTVEASIYIEEVPDSSVESSLEMSLDEAEMSRDASLAEIEKVLEDLDAYVEASDGETVFKPEDLSPDGSREDFYTSQDFTVEAMSEWACRGQKERFEAQSFDQNLNTLLSNEKYQEMSKNFVAAELRSSDYKVQRAQVTNVKQYRLKATDLKDFTEDLGKSSIFKERNRAYLDMYALLAQSTAVRPMKEDALSENPNSRRKPVQKPSRKSKSKARSSYFDMSACGDETSVKSGERGELASPKSQAAFGESVGGSSDGPWVKMQQDSVDSEVRSEVEKVEESPYWSLCRGNLKHEKEDEKEAILPRNETGLSEEKLKPRSPVKPTLPKKPDLGILALLNKTAKKTEEKSQVTSSPNQNPNSPRREKPPIPLKKPELATLSLNAATKASEPVASNAEQSADVWTARRNQEDFTNLEKCGSNVDTSSRFAEESWRNREDEVKAEGLARNGRRFDATATTPVREPWRTTEGRTSRSTSGNCGQVWTPGTFEQHGLERNYPENEFDYCIEERGPLPNNDMSWIESLENLGSHRNRSANSKSNVWSPRKSETCRDFVEEQTISGGLKTHEENVQNDRDFEINTTSLRGFYEKTMFEQNDREIWTTQRDDRSQSWFRGGFCGRESDFGERSATDLKRQETAEQNAHISSENWRKTWRVSDFGDEESVRSRGVENSGFQTRSGQRSGPSCGEAVEVPHRDAGFVMDSRAMSSTPADDDEDDEDEDEEESLLMKTSRFSSSSSSSSSSSDDEGGVTSEESSRLIGQSCLSLSSALSTDSLKGALSELLIHETEPDVLDGVEADHVTVDRSRSTDDLFAVIHRSKRKMFGRSPAPSLHVTPEPRPPTPRGHVTLVGHVTPLADSFRALLKRSGGGGRLSPAPRLSAVERLRRPSSASSRPPPLRPLTPVTSSCRGRRVTPRPHLGPAPLMAAILERHEDEARDGEVSA